MVIPGIIFICINTKISGPNFSAERLSEKDIMTNILRGLCALKFGRPHSGNFMKLTFIKN